MSDQLPAHTSKRVADFLSKYSGHMGRLIFALDATGSRQPTWDSACKLQGQMFAEAAKLGCCKSSWSITAGSANAAHRVGPQMLTRWRVP